MDMDIRDPEPDVRQKFLKILHIVRTSKRVTVAVLYTTFVIRMIRTNRCSTI